MAVSIRDDPRRAEMLSLGCARQETYAFLSDAFARPPSTQKLAAIQSDSFLGSAKMLFSEKALAPLCRGAMSDDDLADVERDADGEFMNLFKVPGGQYVTPYESVFRDTREIAGRPVKGLLMGQSAADVRKWYRLAAVDISDEYKDLPDHICLELDYLAHLCAKEQEFATAGDSARLQRAWEMQRDFLAAHVVSWIGALRDRIHEKSQNVYFRGVADIAVEFTQRDLATLEELLGPSGGESAPAYERVDA